MHPRVLIIATTPYSENYSSRSLDAYFHFWEKENVAQIFTRNIIPTKGHCEELYQIADSVLLKRWLHKVKDTGVVYHYEDLADSGKNQILADSTLQRIGTKHTPTIEIMRRMLWRKRYWCTDQFNDWLDKFQPECIFYNFSDHIFTQQIALYVAERYNIPIIAAIGDDFYFNDQRSNSPSYHLYRSIFKKLTRKLLCRKNSSAVYVNNAIRDKYNNEFGLKGETIYFNSTVERREFKPIDRNDPLICYFGNIRLGRNNSLLDIADALRQIDPHYKLDVYAGESDPQYYRELEEHPDIVYHGAVPYAEVKKKTAECDVLAVVEGFRDKDIAFTKYSLSTKAADSLASGCAILAYGPEEAGVISYLKETGAAFACTDKDELTEVIRKMLSDRDEQELKYQKAITAFEKNHTLESSDAAFNRILRRAIRGE